MIREVVFELINEERDYQDTRWTSETTTSGGLHSWEEWLTYIADYVQEAQHILSRESKQNAHARVGANMRKIAAMAVCAMEQHGAPSRQ